MNLEPSVPPWSVMPIPRHDDNVLRDRLKAAGLHPRKALGQHFLTSRDHLERIVDTIHDAARRTLDAPPSGVLEIGAGPGNLTSALVACKLPVWAVEIDRSYRTLHDETFADDVREGRLTIAYADAMDVEIDDVIRWCEAHGGAPNEIVVAGNIPYNITSPLVFRVLEWIRAGVNVRAAIFLMQREVAERAAAAPGSKTFGVLSAKLPMIAEARIRFNVPAGAFGPPPKVESALLEIRPRPAAERPDKALMDRAWSLIERAFQQRRKMLVSTLAKNRPEQRARVEAWLESIGLSPKARPEEIGHEHWLALPALLAE
jgi:16S rRNA (adenine1518-N6/adenine1519-N6)-dimethyltransferase